MAIEIEDLKTQNKKLQDELDKLRPIHNLFKRVPNKTGRGGHYQISDELNSIGLRAMSHGCVSAKGLEVFCKILSDEFQVLLQIPFDQRQNTRFHQIRDIIQDQWRPLTMQISLVILCWIVIIEPLSELDSIKTPIRRLKELINLADEKFNVIFDCESEHFERFRRMSIRSECSQTVKEVLQICENEWHLASDTEKLQLDQMTLRAFRKAYVKFRKDVDDVLAMEDSDKIVPLSNKHQESFFALYKRYEGLYLHMTDEMLEIIAKAKLNKVTTIEILLK